MRSMRYYLSSYCEIDKMGNLLKTSSRHDHNFALWEKKDKHIKLLYHWEIERISGFKHHSIPFFSKEDYYTFIDSLLEDLGIKREEIVGYIGQEGLDKSIPLPFNDEFSMHSICHLYACMTMDSEVFYNGKILALALDGEPDCISDPDMRNKRFYTGAFSDRGKVELFSINSPGALWTEAVEVLGLPEGTLMALATASLSESYECFDVPMILKKHADILRMRPYVRNICERIMAYDIVDSGNKFNFFDENFTIEENKISMIMKIIQKVSLQIVDQSIESAITKYNVVPKYTYIALGGGYALNCPTNTHVMDKFQFKKQLMIPCVNDGGQSIGIGLYYFYSKINDVKFEYDTPYLGGAFPEYSHCFQEYIEEMQDGIESIVYDLEKQPIVWYDERSESGPRALGHRSILADPRTTDSKDILNIIKQREWWRPVAPIVIAEKCSDWFADSFESRYMLNNFSIYDDKQSIIPAVSHIDGTSRVQTVHKTDGKLYHVLEAFYEKTGIPILCNTSLNDKNEPIIDTIDQAINFALRKRIEVVYVNGKRIKLKNHDKYTISEPLTRASEFFVKYDTEAMRKEINPYDISAKEYGIYKSNPNFRLYDFKDKDEVRAFKRAIGMIKRVYDSKVSNHVIVV